jgi:predicted alpha/beta-fold hydrolase
MAYLLYFLPFFTTLLLWLLVNNFKAELYTTFSILWYSLKGLFISECEEISFSNTKIYKFCSKNKNKKALILIHGLSGTGKSGYIKYIYSKLKNKYDIYAPQYGAEQHMFPTFFPIKEDPKYISDVISLYRDLLTKYDQVSFIGFSAGGGALLQIVNSLKDDDIKKLNSIFFVSPSFKLKEGFEHLENVWFPLRYFMKYDYWKKFFIWIKNKDGILATLKFLYSCRTFDSVFKYLSNNKNYPVLSNNAVIETNNKFILLHTDDDPIVKISDTLDFLRKNSYQRINQLVGGHIGFSALDRCIKFYTDDENLAAQDIWDPSSLIKD